MRSPDPPLADDAIVLRRWHEGDIPVLLELWGEPDVQRWTLQPVPFGEPEARSYLRAANVGWRKGTAARLAIVDRAGSTVAGLVTLRLYKRGIGEVAYALLPRARGRGFATRAVRLVARWAFDDLAVERLELLTHPDNHPSQRVAERAGFTREGVLRSAGLQRGVRFDCVCFSLLPGELG